MLNAAGIKAVFQLSWNSYSTCGRWRQAICKPGTCQGWSAMKKIKKGTDTEGWVGGDFSDFFSFV